MQHLKTKPTLAALLLCGLAWLAPAAEAAQNLVPIPGASYNANTTLAQNLRLLRGRTVGLTLKSGQTISGSIADVGEELVHIERIVGKEFYDALIAIKSITAIEMRFREYQR